MKDPSSGENHGAVSEWEDDGGARGSDVGRGRGNGPEARDRRRSQQERLDATHQSDTRGEHRYPDLHQTRTGREARQARDDLKQRLANPLRQSLNGSDRRTSRP